MDGRQGEGRRVEEKRRAGGGRERRRRRDTGLSRQGFRDGAFATGRRVPTGLLEVEGEEERRGRDGLRQARVEAALDAEHLQQHVAQQRVGGVAQLRDLVGVVADAALPRLDLLRRLGQLLLLRRLLRLERPQGLRRSVRNAVRRAARTTGPSRTRGDHTGASRDSTASSSGRTSAASLTLPSTPSSAMLTSRTSRRPTPFSLPLARDIWESTPIITFKNPPSLPPPPPSFRPSSVYSWAPFLSKPRLQLQ